MKLTDITSRTIRILIYIIIHCVPAALIEMFVTILISFLTGYVEFLPQRIHCIVRLIVFERGKQYINVRARYELYTHAH